jgi:hypothetical protein
MASMRWSVVAALLLASCLAADAQQVTLRGKLTSHQGKPVLTTADHKRIFLSGDEPTTGVLRDKRLEGADFEVVGKRKAPDSIEVDPIHTKAMFVWKNGKRYLVTYWCETCSIRTYTPSVCWCCQEDTQLDLRPADEK